MPRTVWSRRRFLQQALGALAGAGLGMAGCRGRVPGAETFIARVGSYEADLVSVILDGLGALGVTAPEIRSKRILLKPNLVEPRRGAVHINTHPLVVRAAAEAFLRLGAGEVLVAEGAGHRRDSLQVLDESGMGEVLVEDRIPFIDLNYETGPAVPNQGRRSRLASLTFPAVLQQVDWIVSMPKLKTHHWAGVTLSMKNLFGVMPGIFYGWPKNVLHWAGLEETILDITATLRPALAIVDGIVGMEGDGPIMGSARYAGVLVMGRSLPAVDASAARIMGLDPLKVPYLAATEGWLGPVRERQIEQRGETLAAVRTPFALLDVIPAHQGLRKSSPAWLSWF